MTDYQAMHRLLLGLIRDEGDALANLANSAALLYESMGAVNWAGFYLFKENQLVLGPFQGKPACIRIAMGKGVCGAAAQRRESIVVEDVHLFPGHIACDEASASEIVIPIVRDRRLFGVLDVDSPVRARFGEEDRMGLEGFVDILNQYVRWEELPRGAGAGSEYGALGGKRVNRRKIILYGAGICPDCVSAKARLEAAADEFDLDYRDITASTKTLKEFLSFRDREALFAPVVEAGRIGIPLFILEDGMKTFEIRDFLCIEESAPSGSACSLDGKQC